MKYKKLKRYRIPDNKILRFIVKMILITEVPLIIQINNSEKIEVNKK